MKKDFTYREIPYNYTSFSDREIILKYFDQETWDILDNLRSRRVTGRSAKLFFEITGDIFIIDRNPYIFNYFLENKSNQKKLRKLHEIRLNTIEKGANNELVFRLIDKVRAVDSRFFHQFDVEKKERKKILHTIKEITSPANIHFTAFHKVSHVTDASDWRVEYPEVVVYPDSIGEIPGLVRTAASLDLKIIPRGGGTGLTGGAIPVYKNTLVINTEKLRSIGEISIIREGGIEFPVIEVEAGAITESVSEYCKKKGYIFATDPTSAWASTIGGNIAENAGGKKAVMWGTAIDNLFSFQIVNHLGEILEIKRKNHPYRKILPTDTVTFDIYKSGKKGDKNLVKSISLAGTDIRKKGIGKDITNKALGGVPGIQKEGGDGIIISAQFVLYHPFLFVKTICLEFFGNNMVNASKAIVDITSSFSGNNGVFLTALEHFDEKYVSAINYRNKSERSALPKAVLLIDVESNREEPLDASCAKILEMVRPYNTEAFIAHNETAREQFWKDRKNLGAIARHTNAFKLNEDVVIPLESLPAFSDFIEQLNIKKELETSCSTISGIESFLDTGLDETDPFLFTKISVFRDKLKETRERYISYIRNLDRPHDYGESRESLFINDSKPVFEQIREGEISIDMTQVTEEFRQAFHGYNEILTGFDAILKDKQGKKIIIATHMHAGDGNVHVNIPVHSNDYPMLLEADETAGTVMREVIKFGGVISGEHGIGLTKLKFIDRHILDEYARYKNENDPHDLFNPGKLRSDFPLNMIYTPSLNLLEMEAFILEAADLKDLTISISACVRCGKCKEVCNTNYPEGTMFFNPRNKILGVSLIIEAVLYEAQTESTLGFRNFKMLRAISDHCTMCHNCSKPCPVSIDFGEVTLSIRELLVDRNRAKFKFITYFTLFYLKRKGYYINKLFRIAFLKIGYSLQRTAYYINRPFAKLTEIIIPAIAAVLKGRFPRSGTKTLRELLDLKGVNTFFSFQKPGMTAVKNVVYFPGCGSERMFPEISLAVVALLYNSGIRVVIPPEYLCCGYPLLANGKLKQAETKSYENRVIFHRMADIVGYMDIQDIVISCGTCYEMLNKYQIENIFRDAALIDINEFIASHELCILKDINEKLIYHDPCHSPMKTYGFGKTFEKIFGRKPATVPNCCGEGGTLALSTPDISNSLRYRKKTNIQSYLGNDKKAMVLTSCPSCVQGLSKIHGDLTITGTSLTVFIAEHVLGKNWKKRFLKEAKKQGSVEKIIF